MNKMKAKFIIEDIDHLDLTEEESKILFNTVNIIKNKRKKDFIKSLNRATKIVNSWPEWKRNCL